MPQNRAQCDEMLRRLLASTAYRFAPELESKLPQTHGVYVIWIENGDACTFLWVGRTYDGKGGLWRRIWKDHFKAPTSTSDLPLRLLREEPAWAVRDAKQWIQQNCKVRWLEVEDSELRQWLELYAQSVLRPVLNCIVTLPMASWVGPNSSAR